MLSHLALLLLVLASPLPTPAPRADEGAPAAEAAARPRLLERVALIGASVTAGFQLDHDLGEVLEASMARPPEELLVRADSFFFGRPGPVGREQVRAAAAFRPTLVVAVDFPFWFGFGTVDAQGKPLQGEEARLELLEHGLALLDTLDAPLVVGDFPDARAAVGRILAAPQVPAEATRAKLNARLRAWAKERGDVHVVPLAATLEALRSKSQVTLCGQPMDLSEGERWLQGEQLHVTVDGAVLLAQLVAEALRAGGAALGPDEWICKVDAVRERLVGKPLAVPAAAGEDE